MVLYITRCSCREWATASAPEQRRDSNDTHTVDSEEQSRIVTWGRTEARASHAITLGNKSRQPAVQLNVKPDRGIILGLKSTLGEHFSMGVINNVLIYNSLTQQDDCWMSMNSCLATRTLDRFCTSQIQPSFWPEEPTVWVQQSMGLTYALIHLLTKEAKHETNHSVQIISSS